MIYLIFYPGKRHQGRQDVSTIPLQLFDFTLEIIGFYNSIDRSALLSLSL